MSDSIKNIIKYLLVFIAWIITLILAFGVGYSTGENDCESKMRFEKSIF